MADPPLESGETGLSTLPPPSPWIFFFVPKKIRGAGCLKEIGGGGSGPKDVDAGGQEGVGGHRHEFVHETEEARPGACLGTGRGPRTTPPPAEGSRLLAVWGRGRGSPPTPPQLPHSNSDLWGSVGLAAMC